NWPPSNESYGKFLPLRDFCPLRPLPAYVPVPLPFPRPMRFLECVAPRSGRSSCAPMLIRNLLRARRRGGTLYAPSLDVPACLPCAPSDAAVAGRAAGSCLFGPGCSRWHFCARSPRMSPLGFSSLDGEAPRLRTLWLAQRTEALNGGPGDVDRVAAAKRFRQHVRNARRFHNRSHRATSDDAGPEARGLQHHARRTVMRQQWVRDGRALHRHADHLLAGQCRALTDRFWDFIGLTQSDADAAIAIAHDDERAKAEAPPTLDHLGHAVDVDDLFSQLVLGIPVVPIFSHLEPQSCFAGGRRECFDTAVVFVPAAVEDDEFNPVRFRTLGHSFANHGCTLGLRLAGDLRGKVFVRVAGSCQSPAGHVVDNLRVDMAAAAEDVQPRPSFGAGDSAPYASVAALPGKRAGCFAHYLPTFPALPALRRTRSPAYRMP